MADLIQTADTEISLGSIRLKLLKWNSLVYIHPEFKPALVCLFSDEGSNDGTFLQEDLDGLKHMLHTHNAMFPDALQAQGNKLYTFLV